MSSRTDELEEAIGSAIYNLVKLKDALDYGFNIDLDGVVEIIKILEDAVFEVEE
jgi:hypothetical protein